MDEMKELQLLPLDEIVDGFKEKIELKKKEEYELRRDSTYVGLIKSVSGLLFAKDCHKAEDEIIAAAHKFPEVLRKEVIKRLIKHYLNDKDYESSI